MAYAARMPGSEVPSPRTFQTVVRWTARILVFVAIVYAAFKFGGWLALSKGP